MALPTAAYEPRAPSRSPLYRIVLDHLETFRAEAERLRDGAGLPRFVEEEFRGFLRCGQFAAGFARFRCPDCGLASPLRKSDPPLFGRSGPCVKHDQDLCGGI